MFQTTEDYIDDARLERELTGDELMLLPNEDIGTESDLDVELDDNESAYFPLGYFWLDLTSVGARALLAKFHQFLKRSVELTKNLEKCWFE